MFYKAKVGDKKEERMWDDVNQITKILEKLELNKENLTAIEFSSNSISLPVAKKISEKLKETKNLQYLNISDIFVSRKLNEIPEALKDLVDSIMDKKIRIINFSNNAFGPIGVEQISPFLSSTKNLMELHIENCGLGPIGAKKLSEALLNNHNKVPLERLIMNSNRLEDAGATSISAVLKKFKTFERVEFHKNDINEEGMKSLFEAFKENLNLNYIDLNDNKIMKEGIELSKIIPSLKKLKVLKISDGLLGEENSLAIFESLKSCESIEIIECDYNDIEDKKAQEKILSNLFNEKRKKKYKKISLKGNDMNKKVIEKYKSKIHELVHEFIDMSDEEEEGQKYAFEENLHGGK